MHQLSQPVLHTDSSVSCRHPPNHRLVGRGVGCEDERSRLPQYRPFVQIDGAHASHRGLGIDNRTDANNIPCFFFGGVQDAHPTLHEQRIRPAPDERSPMSWAG